MSTISDLMTWRCASPPAPVLRGALLVDTGTTLTEAAVTDAEGRLVAARRVSPIVLMHKHFDHMLGWPRFIGCTAPRGVAEHLSSATDQLSEDALRHGADPAMDDDSDVAAWPATLDRLLAIGGPDAIYIPGHDGVVDAGFVQRQRHWLTRRAAAPGRCHDENHCLARH